MIALLQAWLPSEVRAIGTVISVLSPLLLLGIVAALGKHFVRRAELAALHEADDRQIAELARIAQTVHNDMAKLDVVKDGITAIRERLASMEAKLEVCGAIKEAGETIAEALKRDRQS